MQGDSDGPVSFHYPATDYLASLLDGGDLKAPRAPRPASAAADAIDVAAGDGKP